MSKIKNLQLPLTAQQARELKLGDMVTVSGFVFTGRSRFHIRAVENNIIPAIDFEKINCFFHTGPVMKQTDTDWKIISIEPTSSIRFERYSSDIIRKLKLHMIIGKTTMGKATAKALQEVGGVHLAKIGICGNQLSKQVSKVHEVYFLEELGKTEATWVLEVNMFGPFFVDIDAYGNNYFENMDKDISKRLKEVYKQLGIEEDFSYTEVNAGS